MRPPAIYISGDRPRSVQDFMDRARGQSRPVAKPKCQFVDAAGRRLEKPGIQGFAAIYDTTFWGDGRFVYLKHGCFADSMYQQDKRLLLDHSDDKQVGSSATGLEFVDTSSLHPVNGLAFRMPLSDDNTDSELIYDTVTALDRPCVSVGIKFIDYETITVDGNTVDVVAKARLDEISLVKEGAVPGTNASIVDLTIEEPWLFLAARSHSFVADKLVGNLQAGAARLAEKVKKLVA